MPALLLIATAPVFVYIWATTHPGVARALVAELKRQWRLYLTQHEGKRVAQDFIRDFRTQMTSKGFDNQLVEEIINERKTEIIERLGRKQANAQLGEPTPLERHH
jgi:uncharacterized protein (UPF0335 family)